MHAPPYRHFKNGNNHTYTIEPIEGPLLNVAGSAAKQAVAIFKLICQFMGITARVGKSTVKAIEGVRQIVGPALKDDQLKDEVFAQIMKQWTRNPAPLSRARGTILLGLCIGAFAPSSQLLPSLRSFILEGPKGFVPYCNLLLRRTLHNGQRMEPPCQLELAAVKKKQILRIQVITDLSTGMTVRTLVAGRSPALHPSTILQPCAAVRGLWGSRFFFLVFFDEITWADCTQLTVHLQSGFSGTRLS